MNLSHQYWRTDVIYSLLVQLAAHQASLFVSEHGLIFGASLKWTLKELQFVDLLFNEH